MASQVPSRLSVSSRDEGRFIRAGDLVVVFASRDKASIPLTIVPGEFLSNVFGHFAHDDMIGMPYGSKMISKNKKGYLYLLRPTPEIWTSALPHRTQILYAPDMSFITMKLNLGPGCRAIEAGTGSGSFSHFLGRTVGRGSEVTSNVETFAGTSDRKGQVVRNWKGLPNDMQTSSRGTRNPNRAAEAEQHLAGASDSAATGIDPQSSAVAASIDGIVPECEGRLWSFEFHAGRAEKARAEFAAHGLDRIVTLTHRNVCKDGFGLCDAADAVFLDLPAPWEAIPFAETALRRKTLGRICCFSPCIEQVLKTVTALTEHGFTDIETFESLVKTHESSMMGPEVTIDEAINRIKEVEKRKEARRLTQIEKARTDKSQEEGPKQASQTDFEHGTGSANGTDVDISISSNGAGTTSSEAAKKRKRSVEESGPADSGKEDTEPQNGVEAVAITKRKARQLQQQKQQSTPFQAATVFSRPYPEMRGHTSYLTFATLLPRDMGKVDAHS